MEISSIFSIFKDFFFLKINSYPYFEDYLIILLVCILPALNFVLDLREGNLVSTDLFSPKNDLISTGLLSI